MWKIDNSWSKQARRLSNVLIKWIRFGAISYEDAKEMIFNFYCAPIVKNRALKRLNRWHREGKI